MLESVRRFKLIATFIRERRSDYAELAAVEWAEVSHALVRFVCGSVVAVLALGFFFGFFSLAIVVSAWESEWRIATAWIVAVAWLLVCAGGATAVWMTLHRIHLLEGMRAELSKDVATIGSVL